MSTVLKFDAREFEQILEVAGCNRGKGLMGWISRGHGLNGRGRGGVSIGAGFVDIPVKKPDLPEKQKGPLSNAFIAFLEQESAVRSPVVLPADLMSQAYKSTRTSSSSTPMGSTDMSLIFNNHNNPASAHSSRNKSIIPLPADSIRSQNMIIPNTAPVILESNLSGLNTVLPSAGRGNMGMGNALFPGM